MNERFLRRSEVQKITGLPRSSLYELMAAGRFPASFKLSERRVAWRESAVMAWMAEKGSSHSKSPSARLSAPDS